MNNNIKATNLTDLGRCNEVSTLADLILSSHVVPVCRVLQGIHHILRNSDGTVQHYHLLKFPRQSLERRSVVLRVAHTRRQQPRPVDHYLRGSAELGEMRCS